MRNLSVLAAVLSVGLATTACDIRTDAKGEFSFDIASGKATETWSRTYKLADQGRFELINVNGKIAVEPTDGTEIVVEGHKTAKARSDEAAKELLTKLEIREEVGELSVRVESRPPRLSGFSSHQIEWTVKVPKGVILDLRTTNGGIRLHDIANEVRAQATNGGIRGEAVSPSVLEATAVNGGIQIALSEPIDATDSIEMETVNGGVMLSLSPESKVTIQARCVNGGVHVDGLEIAKEQQSGDVDKHRRLNGTMNGGGGRVKMSTTNGGVHLSAATGKGTT